MNGIFDIAVIVTQLVNQKKIRSQQHWLDLLPPTQEIPFPQHSALCLSSQAVLFWRTHNSSKTHICVSVSHWIFTFQTVVYAYGILYYRGEFVLRYFIGSLKPTNSCENWKYSVNGNTIFIPCPSTWKKFYSNTIQRKYDLKWICTKKEYDD